MQRAYQHYDQPLFVGSFAQEWLHLGTYTHISGEVNVRCNLSTSAIVRDILCRSATVVSVEHNRGIAVSSFGVGYIFSDDVSISDILRPGDKVEKRTSIENIAHGSSTRYGC